MENTFCCGDVRGVCNLLKLNQSKENNSHCTASLKAHLKVSARNSDVLEEHGLPVVEVVLGVVLAASDAAEAVHLRDESAAGEVVVSVQVIVISQVHINNVIRNVLQVNMATNSSCMCT